MNRPAVAQIAGVFVTKSAEIERCKRRAAREGWRSIKSNNQVSECLTNQASRVCKRRNSLANSLWLTDIDPRLGPLSFSGEPLQLTDEPDEVTYRPVHDQGSVSWAAALTSESGP